ncbi:hypothetical protein IFM89_029277 [Coptis chinensis]|uniref:F-box associated beta-propeller type 3 domain-containing protein n=1 Tax=Coptis chinensis TaxID=261450 RepID=A0A835LTC5_9MAGN|nr:hypothetical protein IFM89_029277 [Coptis chinensis]
MKSLYSCKQVCKSWYNIIKHLKFIQLHLLNNNNNNPNNNPPCLIIRQTWNEDYRVRLIYNNNNNNNPPCLIIRQTWNEDYHVRLIYNENVKALDETTLISSIVKVNSPPKRYVEIYSCNGLIFTVAKFNGWVLDIEPYFIINPITQDQIVVPKPPLIECIKDYLFGFGFDPVSKVFKVITIVTLQDTVCEIVAQVYNVGTNEWGMSSEIQFNIPSKSNDNESNKESNVFVNRALHWIGSTKISTGNTAQQIVLFNLDTEEFQQLPLPPGLGDKNIKRNLLVLGECLGVVHAIHAEYIRIWVMKDYRLESSWSKEYIIRHMPIDTSGASSLSANSYDEERRNFAFML